MAKFNLKLVYEALTNTQLPPHPVYHNEYRVMCPIHLHRRPSCDLNLEKSLWRCRSCEAGGDALAMVLACDQFSHLEQYPRKQAVAKAAEWIRSLDPGYRAELPPVDLAATGRGRNVAHVLKRYTFTYTDADGTPLYDEIRLEGTDAQGDLCKDIFARRHLPRGGAWYRKSHYWVYYGPGGELCHDNDGAPFLIPLTLSDGTERRRPMSCTIGRLGAVERVMYRLPELRRRANAGEMVVMPEGPKKADVFRDTYGFCSTTIHGGSAAAIDPAWQADIAGTSLLIIVADDDEVGRQAAWERAIALKDPAYRYKTRMMLLPNPKSIRGYSIDDWDRDHAHLPVAQRKALLLDIFSREGNL